MKLLTIILLLFAGAMLVLGAVRVFDSARSEIVSIHETCYTVEDREFTRGILLQAADQGLNNQTIQIFNVWVKEELTPQAARGRVGIERGIVAHKRLRNNILLWNPPICEGAKP